MLRSALLFLSPWPPEVLFHSHCFLITVCPAHQEPCAAWLAGVSRQLSENLDVCFTCGELLFSSCIAHSFPMQSANLGQLIFIKSKAKQNKETLQASTWYVCALSFQLKITLQEIAVNSWRKRSRQLGVGVTFRLFSNYVSYFLPQHCLWKFQTCSNLEASDLIDA